MATTPRKHLATWTVVTVLACGMTAWASSSSSTTTTATARDVSASLAADTGISTPIRPAVVSTKAGSAGKHDAGPNRDLQASLRAALLGTVRTGHGPSATAYDPSTDTIYVANGFNPNGPELGGNTVTVIDGRRCDARAVAGCKGPWPTLTVGERPSALAVDTEHQTLYVASHAEDTVSVVDTRRCRGRDTSGCAAAPTAEVPIGNGPVGIHVDADTGTVYVANFDDNTVSMIDTARCNGSNSAGCLRTPAPAFSVPDGPGDIDVNHRTHTAYVAHLTGLAAVDTHTCNGSTQTGCADQGVLTICSECFGAFSAKVDESTNTIYEGDGDKAIAAIDGRACNAAELGRCASAPFGMVHLPGTFYSHVLSLVVDEALHSVYVLNQKDDTVVMIDTTVCNGAHRTGCKILEPEFVRTGTNPTGITLDPRTHTVYVADQLDDDISVIDAARCSALDTSGCRRLPPRISLPDPLGVAVSEAVHTAYVAGPHGVSMVDIRSCNVSRLTGCTRPHPSVPIGDRPVAIAVNDRTHSAYVANAGSAGSAGSVAVFDTHACNAHPAGCTLVATMQLPQGTGSEVVVNATTDSVYVGAADSKGDDAVAVFDGSTCNATRTSGCGQRPATMTLASGAGQCDPPGPSRMALAVDETTDSVYAAHLPCGAPGLADRIYVYDGSTCGSSGTSGCGGPIATISEADDPFGLEVDEATRTLYAPLLGDGEKSGAVAVVDVRTCNAHNTSGCDRARATAPAEFGSLGVAVDPASHNVYVANDEDASVSVIRGQTCRANNTSGCGRTPALLLTDDYPTPWISLAPSVRTAYLTSTAKGSVSVLPMLRTRCVPDRADLMPGRGRSRPSARIQPSLHSGRSASSTGAHQPGVR